MADKSFKLIAITPESANPDDERQRVLAIVDAGFTYVHLRKLAFQADDARRWLDAMPPHVVKRIKLHSHFSLAKEYPVAGLHLNSRNPEPPADTHNLKLSKSCHSLDELDECRAYEYATLSPIFQSISKQGYHGRFNLNELKLSLTGPSGHDNVVALGGVTPRRLRPIAAAGFAGAAFLGYLFNRENINNALKAILEETKSI